MTRNRLLWRCLLALVVGAVATEVGSWVAVRYLVKRGIVYEVVLDGSVQAYARERDPLLGWPSPARIGWEPFDASGSRIVPAFPDPAQPACVSLYGDSFTWGDDVSNEEAWGNRLAQSLNCRVANFGVDAYGTDQAYLRFQHNTADRAPTVLLGFLSENLVRNVTRLFNQLYHTRQIGLKPRFIRDPEGGIRLVPIPDLPAAELEALLRRPDRYLQLDFLVPGGPTGTVRAAPPYALTFARACFSYRAVAGLKGRPFWTEFYRQDHPSKALEITELIMQSFRDGAEADGRRPLVVIFPLTDDLDLFRRRGTWTYQPLIDRLRERSVPFLNLGEGLAEYLGDRETASVYTRPRGGHLNAEGNVVVAEIVEKRLRRSGYVAGQDEGR